jgi:hypothetical protein
MRSEPRRAPQRAAALAAVALLVASGCTAPRAVAGAPLIAQPALAEDELGFWQALESAPRVAVDDALHALLLLADGEADHASFASRRAVAGDRGWIEPDAQLQANDAATIGMVASAICRIVPLERGVSGTLFPRAQRWCVRDLVFLGLLPERAPAQTLRGLELIELVGRVEDWRRDHTARAAAPATGAGS